MIQRQSLVSAQLITSGTQQSGGALVAKRRFCLFIANVSVSVVHVEFFADMQDIVMK